MIILKFDFHYPTPYDGTLQTFTMLKIKKIMMPVKISKRRRKSAQSEPPILNRLEMAAS
jgi:hypothetical protein